MTREEWSIVRGVFEASRSLSGREREIYLSGACPSEVTREEVESLLAVYASDTRFLEEPALAGTGTDELLESGQGQVGCYQIMRRIGEGGMSVVYEAWRRDGQFRQRVAIKILKRGMDTASLLQRFRTERQILAEFQHPHIAQLLDGGAMPDGRPFLAMEFIDGEPLTEYCDRQRLSIMQRLDLFLQVCSAVQTAHQNLIVHRDIKPSNILVTAEGECKLLDFGIAKILEPERYERQAAWTTASERLLTPEYASPEQIRGEAITTTSDVYSLGVLGYELLTGRSPYGPALQVRDEPARVEEIPRPSDTVARDYGAGRTEEIAAARGTTPARLQRALRGDLDNILLRTLRENPERRYASVEQLAEDIRRHQEGRPITARQERLGYVAWKLINRNKALSSVAALLVIAVTLGITAALWQAHRAEVEKERAERRFAEIRRVAGSLVFELHAAIAPLRGATAARELVLRRATEMLNGLAKEAGDDVALNLELAEAYRRLADVQGNPLDNNIGDKRGALRSYREAIRLGEAALRADPQNTAAMTDVGSSYQALSNVAEGREGEDALNKAIRLHEAVIRERPSDLSVRGILGVDYQRRGAFRTDRSDFAGGLQDQRRSVELLQQVADAHKPTASDLKHLAFAHKRVGALLIHQNRLDEALKEYQEGLAIDERVMRASPVDANAEFNTTFALNDIGLIYRMRGEFAKALEYHRKSVAIRESQAAGDPTSVRLRGGLARSLSQSAFDLTAMGELAGALQDRLRALAILSDLATANPKNVPNEVSYAEEEIWTGDVLAGVAGRSSRARRIEAWRGARAHYQRAYDIARSMNSSDMDRAEMSALARKLAQCDTHLRAGESEAR